ncbi:uncharacterized protein PHALS_08208 [Plasmopara halstedii]|uniref:Uncharacterized protein n=1 Tax=Plasmopara halstedii TaxID=4781 RepID=A0A0P1AB42_PLAHL|nr:uncharacterized protein PHALS_08208 [Plasmopara halstedii]CEG38116.1 hypothetical protein PHALS_08208 [Plasmopara halstedii]|eukprot:XP_024574485.1 hypothetical protein PHALS_08208 [Plasmopara halstedii]
MLALLMHYVILNKLPSANSPPPFLKLRNYTAEACGVCSTSGDLHTSCLLPESERDNTFRYGDDDKVVVIAREHDRTPSAN